MVVLEGPWNHPANVKVDQLATRNNGKQHVALYLQLAALVCERL